MPVARIPLLLIMVACLGLGGCAVGRTLDTDEPMVGLTVSGAGAAATTVGTTVGGLLFGPQGAAAGGALGTLIFGGYAAKRHAAARAAEAERAAADRAWDEAYARGLEAARGGSRGVGNTETTS